MLFGCQNHINLHIGNSEACLNTLFHGSDGVEVPDGRSSEPFGVHCFHRREHTSVSEGALHDSKEIGLQVKVNPVAGKDISKSDRDGSLHLANTSELFVNVIVKRLVVVESSLSS